MHKLFMEPNWFYSLRTGQGVHEKNAWESGCLSRILKSEYESAGPVELRVNTCREH